jgi:asparagine synthase (glutamine-hydrolysing)
MLHSLEVRAPFLDYRVIEFAFGKVPSRLKATSNARKILTKRVAARLLPREFDFERKQGFSIPLDVWLQNGPWRQTFEEILMEGQERIFDQRFIVSLLNGQVNGRSNSERLFALALFELWRREYNVALA